MKLKVYLSGPVSGRNPIITERMFTLYEKAVLDMNMQPVNPLKLGCKNKSWSEDMKLCLRALIECNLIIMLPDWQNSEGARLEQLVAKSLKINELKLKV